MLHDLRISNDLGISTYFNLIYSARFRRFKRFKNVFYLVVLCMFITFADLGIQQLECVFCKWITILSNYTHVYDGRAQWLKHGSLL